MNLDDFPLSVFDVDCDGSACGSSNVGWHVHQAQGGGEPVCRVRVTSGVRTYLEGSHA